jgi:hypothetical protein
MSSDLAHPTAFGYGFARGESVRGTGAATLGTCRRCSVGGEQPERHMICSHSPSKGSCLCAPPAQGPFSPLLFAVEGVEPCCRIGDTPRSLQRFRCILFDGKDADGRSGCVWNTRGATRGTAEDGLLQLLQLAQQADGVECVCHLEQLLLFRGRQHPCHEQPLQGGRRWIIHAAYFLPFTLVRQQFHRGLKTVARQAERPVQFGELPRGVFPHQVVRADQLFAPSLHVSARALQ